jgi:predicted RND superfamily exporter protein
MDMKEVTRVSHDPINLSDFGEQASSFKLEEATKLGFVSDDGELHIILAEPATDLKGGKDVVVWQKAVFAAIDDWRAAHPDLAEGTIVQLTGRKIYMTEVTNALRKDLMVSVLITLGFVAVLFGLLYRRVLPLLLLLVSLYITFVLTLLIGQMIYPDLSAMAVGFAAILLGLAVDYGFVIYQEACCSGRDPRTLRRLFGRCIGWAALTTACVFLALNRSIMPGAAQLGTMVAIGVCVGALMMIFPYASALGRLKCTSDLLPPARTWFGSARVGRWGTLALFALTVIVLVSQGLPALNSDPEKLRPEQRQESVELYHNITKRLGSDGRTLTLMADASSDAEMLDIFQKAQAILERTPEAESSMLPTRLWPHANYHDSNRALLEKIVEAEASVIAKAASEEFIEEALTLTKRAFTAWRTFLQNDQAFQLQEPSSRWLLDKLMVSTPNQRLAIGFVRLQEGHFILPLDTVAELNEVGLRPIGWDFLGPEIRPVLLHDVKQVVIPTAIILLVLLTIVFRSIKGVCLSVILLVSSAMALMAIMRLIDIDWNIVNIGAIPLLLGLGLDYSIHVILALRRTHGNVASIRTNIGRALMLCGTTTAVGFGSLMSARYGGLPQLGQLCAIGILITMITAIFLVPHWWRFLHKKELHDRPSD